MTRLYDITLRRANGTETTRRGQLAARQVDEAGRVYGNRVLIKDDEDITGAVNTEIQETRA